MHAPAKLLLYPTINSRELFRALFLFACLHTMGALAELEMGPTARNIAGARRAAARIVQAE